MTVHHLKAKFFIVKAMQLLVCKIECYKQTKQCVFDMYTVSTIGVKWQVYVVCIYLEVMKFNCQH